jgi:hypothetical protein
VDLPVLDFSWINLELA